MSAGDEVRDQVHDRITRSQMRAALSCRAVIGQAEGILMERLGIEGPRAFEYLRRVSMHTNRKLVDVAEEIVRTRALPDLQHTTALGTLL